MQRFGLRDDQWERIKDFCPAVKAMSAAMQPTTGCTSKPFFIPKLRNHDSCYPTLCGDDCIENVSQIKHLDGRDKPAATPQVGRG